jgi:ATP-dependent DNA helicase RecQ
LLLARLHKHPRDAATIVYVTLQKTAEDVAAAIAASGLSAAHYHAGLNDDERNSIQNNFMNGATPIVVATIAFGMGIDKSNIRAVYHFNLPKSIENYVQEIGRAGRDGLPSLCEMFAVADDIRVLENFTYGDTPSTESIKSLVEYLLAQQAEFDISTYELSNRFDLRPLVLTTALTYLELQGVIVAQSPFYTEYKIQFLQGMDIVLAQFDATRADFLRRLFAAGKRGTKWLTLDMIGISEKLQEPKERITKALDYLAEKGAIELTVASLRQTYRNMGIATEAQNLQKVQNAQDLQSLLETLFRLFAEREARDITRIQSILAYANNPKCLSQQLIEYFGEEANACGICSHCRAQARTEPITQVAALVTPQVTAQQRELIAEVQGEHHAALQQTRQLARFLCGLPSPATARSSLRQHKAFGALENLGFQQLLALAK